MIRRLCGDQVRYICLQRHGLDVVLSLEELVERTGGYPPELHRWLRAEASPRRALARAWVECAEALADLADSDESALDVRYETLVSAPEETLRAVLVHLGESWEDGLIERALEQHGALGFGDWKSYSQRRVSTARVGRRAALSGAAQRELLDICGPTLERLGYPREEPPPAPPDPLRRYELSLLLRFLHPEDGEE